MSNEAAVLRRSSIQCFVYVEMRLNYATPFMQKELDRILYSNIIIFTVAYGGMEVTSRHASIGRSNA